MKVLLKNTKILLLVFIIPILNIQCEDCLKSLADLTTRIAVQGAVSIISGVPFELPNLIQNVPDVVNACITTPALFKAVRSKSRIKVDYDGNGDGSFESNELNNNFEVPEIDVNQMAEENYELIFDEPGDYRVITFADDFNDVEEQNEKNNTSNEAKATAGFRANSTSNYSSSPLIITVLPSSTFDSNKENSKTKRVTILKRTVTVKHIPEIIDFSVK